MEFHPVANIFPLMDAEALNALKADIKANGLKEPVWTHEDKIIDGRNRYRACTDLGINPAVRSWDGKGSLVTFVVSLNLHRRHLSSSQKAAIAADIEPMLADEAKQRQRASGGDRKSEAAKAEQKSVVELLPQPIPQHREPPKQKPVEPKAREQAAKITGTNPRYVSDAKLVKEKAPELHAKVRDGTMTLPQAKRAVIREEKREDLKAKAAAVLVTNEAQPWNIINGDCIEELTKIGSATHRLVFTDPPYNIGVDYGGGKNDDLLPDEKFVAWCGQWIRECSRILTDDGSLWLLIGDEYADYIGIELRKAGLHRRSWIKWYESFGVNTADNFNRCSRHLFYCVKNPKSFVFHADAVNRPSDRQLKYNDQRADPEGKVWDNVWGINPPIARLTGTCAERIPDFPTQLPLALVTPIVLCASDPGDRVLDPFNGSGTTGDAAVGQGRQYTGIEKSEKFAEIARLRLTSAKRGAA